MGTQIDPSIMCAGPDQGGKDSCTDDSGGPLVCLYNGRWHLEGAVSGGHGCARPGYYGIYADIRTLQRWIKYVMKHN